MHKHVYPTLIGLLVCLCVWTCKKEVFIPLGFVSVETAAPDISFDGTITTITLSGDLDEEDTDSTNNEIIEQGFILSTRDADPTLTNNVLRYRVHEIDGQLMFDTTLNITELLALGRFFRFRAYAINQDLATQLPESSVVLGNTLTFEFQPRVSIFSVQAECSTGGEVDTSRAVAIGKVSAIAEGVTIESFGFIYDNAGVPTFESGNSEICDSQNDIDAFNKEFVCNFQGLDLTVNHFFRAFIIQSQPIRDTFFSDVLLTRVNLQDSDGDSIPDICDDDDDNDGCLDIEDDHPFVHSIDFDGDGDANDCDEDDDADGINDDEDGEPFDNLRCGDNDGNLCDDCFGDDDVDFDSDGLCNGIDPDDDNDGVPDQIDGINGAFRLDPTRCGSSDGDECDDCSTGVDGLGPLSDFRPEDDGSDFDNDLICDISDPDIDNDGRPNEQDNNGLSGTNFEDYSMDPTRCGSMDGDTCDDCTNQVDGIGPLSDVNPDHDGC